LCHHLAFCSSNLPREGSDHLTAEQPYGARLSGGGARVAGWSLTGVLPSSPRNHIPFALFLSAYVFYADLHNRFNRKQDENTRGEDFVNVLPLRTVEEVGSFLPQTRYPSSKNKVEALFYPVLPDFRNSTAFFGGKVPSLLPLCRSLDEEEYGTVKRQ